MDTATFTVHRLDRSTFLLEWEVRFGEVVAGYLRAQDDGDSLYIENIGIDPKFRRNGLATRLLETSVDHAAGREIRLVAAPFPSWREAGPTHEELSAWYGRHGFHSTPLRGDPHLMTRTAAPPTTEK